MAPPIKGGHLLKISYPHCGERSRPEGATVTLGVVATNLLNTVREAKNKAINFKAILADLETTIIKLVPKVSSIEQLSEEYGDLPKAEIQQLKLELGRATQLVSKCKEIAWWNYCNKYRYSYKLRQLRATLRRLIEMELPVGTRRIICRS
ncbi:hypothetical protein I3843_02G006800 [Carya illinoinensis]|nr:hypothetical protein I3843_02G006800 [Carya illinoinensis]